MTKQQLREAIRRVIKQELNEGLLMSPAQMAYVKGYEDGQDGKPMDISSVNDLDRFGNSGMNEEKTVPNPNAGKWDKKEKPLTDKFYDSKAEAEEASSKIGKINAVGKKIIQLKDTMKVHEGPAVAPDETEEDVETMPYISPNEDDDDLDVGKKDHPKIPAQAKTSTQFITPKEKSAIKQIMARYISTLNVNERKKYK